MNPNENVSEGWLDNVKDVFKRAAGQNVGSNRGAFQSFSTAFVQNAINDLSIAFGSQPNPATKQPGTNTTLKPRPTRTVGIRPGSARPVTTSRTTEDKYHQLNQVFEELINEANTSSTIAGYTLNWVRQYTSGINMGDWSRDPTIQALAREVQKTWYSDKGKAALSKMAAHIWSRAKAGMSPNNNTPVTKPLTTNTDLQTAQTALQKLQKSNPTEYAKLVSQLKSTNVAPVPSPGTSAP